MLRRYVHRPSCPAGFMPVPGLHSTLSALLVGAYRPVMTFLSLLSAQTAMSRQKAQEKLQKAKKGGTSQLKTNAAAASYVVRTFPSRWQADAPYWEHACFAVPMLSSCMCAAVRRVQDIVPVHHVKGQAE